MTKKVDEAVYDGLSRAVDKRRMSQFNEHLPRQYALLSALDDGYKAMAADHEREAEAAAWCNALSQNLANEVRWRRTKA